MMRESLPLILFGGTFDPVHRAHIELALAASGQLGQAQVHLLPNALPPHRPQPQADGEQRLAMLKLACAEHPNLEADDWELRQTGPSYSLRTLHHFRDQIGPQRPLVWMIGADSYANLHHWHRWEDYPALCHLLVAPRPGAATAPTQVQSLFPPIDASQLYRQPSGGCLLLEQPLQDISATAIRQSLAEKGHSDAILPTVLDHIRRHHLYNVAQNRAGSNPSP